MLNRLSDVPTNCLHVSDSSSSSSGKAIMYCGLKMLMDIKIWSQGFDLCV
jgi:hypothetical protein